MEVKLSPGANLLKSLSDLRLVDIFRTTLNSTVNVLLLLC